MHSYIGIQTYRQMEREHKRQKYERAYSKCLKRPQEVNIEVNSKFLCIINFSSLSSPRPFFNKSLW